MNQQIRDFPSNGHSDSPPWRIYKKTSEITDPPPVKLWVMIDENPDSINDAAFAVGMNYMGRSSLWQDGPGTGHGGACGFTFADGHSEIKKWKDGRTTRRPMLTTYSYRFPYGVLHGDSQDIQWIQERTTAKIQ